jgi:hypothetical protein
MTASTTTNDGDLACATAVTRTPATSSTNGGYGGVRVNGLHVVVGDGTKTGADCYFSGDGGTTARAMKSIVAGDQLYWQHTIAGYNLDAATDKVDFVLDTAA